MRYQYQTTAVRQPSWMPPHPGMTSKTAAVRAQQIANGEEPCFMTQKRLLCARIDCEWRAQCRRLIAAWKR